MVAGCGQTRAPECGLLVAGGVDQKNLLLKKQGWRQFESLAEFFDVMLVQPPFAMQDFADDALRPAQRREVLLLEVGCPINSANTSAGDTAPMGKCSSS
jgi:hypothetical protein